MLCQGAMIPAGLMDGRIEVAGGAHFSASCPFSVFLLPLLGIGFLGVLAVCALEPSNKILPDSAWHALHSFFIVALCFTVAKEFWRVIGFYW